MCIGGAPQAPRIVYQGPSKAELAANEQRIGDYQKAAQQQQTQFASALQQQIDEANRRIGDQEAQLQAELTAAQAAAAAQQTTAYATTTTTTPPENPKVTEAIKKKDPSKGSLKIGMNSGAASAGTGLNIGV